LDRREAGNAREGGKGREGKGGKLRLKLLVSGTQIQLGRDSIVLTGRYRYDMISMFRKWVT
jgi:hypothetical protein